MSANWKPPTAASLIETIPLLLTTIGEGAGAGFNQTATAAYYQIALKYWFHF